MLRDAGQLLLALKWHLSHRASRTKRLDGTVQISSHLVAGSYPTGFFREPYPRLRTEFQSIKPVKGSNMNSFPKYS